MILLISATSAGVLAFGALAGTVLNFTEAPTGETALTRYCVDATTPSAPQPPEVCFFLPVGP